jgi:hypothetical protein
MPAFRYSYVASSLLKLSLQENKSYAPIAANHIPEPTTNGDHRQVMNTEEQAAENALTTIGINE